MRRRAFTLLELMTALTLGTIVLGACLGLFGLMTRTDGVLERRAEHINDLARAHFIVQRVLGALVMSDDPAPPPELRDQLRTDPAAEEEPAPDEPAPGEPAEEMEAAAVSHGRFILAQDPVVLRMAQRQMNRLGPDAPQIPPQMLEVAALSMAAPHGRKIITSRFDSGYLYEQTTMPRRGSGVVRGVFYFYPDNPEALTRATGTRESTTWSLYWKAMPDDSAPADGEYFEDRSDEQEVRLISGLKSWGQWTVFKDRSHLPEYSAKWADDLPAYVRLEVETGMGLAGQWIFEVGWTIGPEGMNEPPPEEELDDEAASQEETGGTPARLNPPGRPAGGPPAGSTQPVREVQPGRVAPVRRPGR